MEKTTFDCIEYEECKRRDCETCDHCVPHEEARENGYRK